MPEYCYENQRGERITLYRKVEERDENVPDGYKRILEAGKLGFTGLHPVYLQGNEVLKGCKAVENQIGTAALEKQMGFKADQTKRIWSKRSSQSRF